MNKLLVICGPTATGKTRIAADLARKFDVKISTLYEKEKAEKKFEAVMEKRITNILERISKL